jgi:hypothetical protein
VVGLYAKRFRMEETFRDVKNLRLGMGLSSAHVKSPDRRDRLLLVSALACALLMLLGAAGESLGMERYLKANTVTCGTRNPVGIRLRSRTHFPRYGSLLG